MRLLGWRYAGACVFGKLPLKAALFMKFGWGPYRCSELNVAIRVLIFLAVERSAEYSRTNVMSVLFREA